MVSKFLMSVSLLVFSFFAFLHLVRGNTVKLGYNEVGCNELGYNELVCNELGYNELGYNELAYNEQNPVITNEINQ
jgi:hypothetical protein